MKRTYWAEWYNRLMGEWVSAVVTASNYAEAVAKLNAQYAAGIDLDSKYRMAGGGRKIWSAGRAGVIACRPARRV
jgi:hypothetical protein